MRRPSFSPSGQHLSISDIADHFEGVKDSLSYYYTSRESRAANHPLATEEELEKEYRAAIFELEMTTCLSLLVALEALFRLDYLFRAEMRLKDDMSREFGKIYARHRERARFDILLKVWKRRVPAIREHMQRLSAAAHFRDWLAHGRYWIPHLARKHGYLDIYELASAIEQEVSFKSFRV